MKSHNHTFMRERRHYFKWYFSYVKYLFSLINVQSFHFPLLSFLFLLQPLFIFLTLVFLLQICNRNIFFLFSPTAPWSLLLQLTPHSAATPKDNIFQFSYSFSFWFTDYWIAQRCDSRIFVQFNILNRRIPLIWDSNPRAESFFLRFDLTCTIQIVYRTSLITLHTPLE